MRVARSLTAPAVAVVALGLLGCGSPEELLSDEELASADVMVVTEDMRYVEPPTQLAAGPTTIALMNDDGAPHDVTIEGPAGTVVEANRRSEALGSVTLEPGVYEVYCSVGGHRDAGMSFDLTVT